jgi:Cu(I)/Ag(I) efflux system membrane fusion protein
LILYREQDSGRLWLQQSGVLANPYGSGAADIMPWPDPMAGMDASPTPDAGARAVDPHAGHR